MKCRKSSEAGIGLLHAAALMHLAAMHANQTDMQPSAACTITSQPTGTLESVFAGLLENLLLTERRKERWKEERGGGGGSGDYVIVCGWKEYTLLCIITPNV